jgi:hypothetical protein
MPSIASPLAGQRFVLTTYWSSGTSSTNATGEHGMCKTNIAAHDRRILPHGNSLSVALLELAAALLCAYKSKQLGRCPQSSLD